MQRRGMSTGTPVWRATRRATALAVVAIGLAAAPSAAATSVSSTFNTDHEAWGHMATSCSNGNGVGQLTPSWQAAGGNPGGFVRIVAPSEGNWSYYYAPMKFRGNQSAFAGGTLSFDLRSNFPMDHAFNCSVPRVGDVELRGAGRAIQYDIPGATMAANVWHRLQVPLSASGWTYYGGSMPVWPRTSRPCSGRWTPSASGASGRPPRTSTTSTTSSCSPPTSVRTAPASSPARTCCGRRTTSSARSR